MPQNTRETLYQSLPPLLKSSLRAKLKSFRVKEEVKDTYTQLFPVQILFYLFMVLILMELVEVRTDFYLFNLV